MINKLILNACALFFLVSTPVSAATIDDDTKNYLRNRLLAQVEILKSLLEEKMTGLPSVTGDVSVTMVSPKQFGTVIKGESFNIVYEVDNAPVGSKLIYEKTAARSDNGRPRAIGSGSVVLPPGDSSGIILQRTDGGYAFSGTYDIRVLVQECVDLLCTKSPNSHSPETGEKIYGSEIYAQSDWTRFTIQTEPGLAEKLDPDKVISQISPGSGNFPYNEEMTISFYLDLSVGDNKTCIGLNSLTGKGYSLSTNERSACFNATPGLNTFPWTPVYTPGFKLEPGQYQVRISVQELDSNPVGKEAPSIGSRTGDWFTISNDL